MLNPADGLHNQEPLVVAVDEQRFKFQRWRGQHMRHVRNDRIWTKPVLLIETRITDNVVDKDHAQGKAAFVDEGPQGMNIACWRMTVYKGPR